MDGEMLCPRGRNLLQKGQKGGGRAAEILTGRQGVELDLKPGLGGLWLMTLGGLCMPVKAGPAQGPKGRSHPELARGQASREVLGLSWQDIRSQSSRNVSFRLELVPRKRSPPFLPLPRELVVYGFPESQELCWEGFKLGSGSGLVPGYLGHHSRAGPEYPSLPLQCLR